MKKEVRRIFLKNLLNNECVHEKIEQFSQSIYRDVYEEALILIQRFTEDTRRKIFYKNIDQKETDIKNVISFIGRRGTGKTSAMVSFCEALLRKDDVVYKEEKNQVQKELGENVVFVGIDYIDASRLEESEDIFVLVLAGMLNKLIEFDTEIEQGESRTLYQKFDKIFNDFSILRQKNGHWNDSYSSFEKLRNIASSQKIREQFSKLVEEYLEVMAKQTKSFQTSFLVIMIDDIDMRKKDRNNCGKNSGVYDILQSIYQYLSVPRVIILTAYNHEYLYQQCIDYFYGNGRKRCCNEKESDYVIKNNTNEKMASEYMQKVLPIEARLYMPSWRKRDYGNEHLIDISEQEEYLKNFLQADLKLLDVKRFILNLLAEKTEIYYDCEGKKKHFFEPDTIRSLCSKTLILICLKEFGTLQEDDFDMEVYKRNLKRVKDDLFFRYAEEKLVKVNEKILFDSWLSQPIDRRGKFIVKEITGHSSFKPLGKKHKQKNEKYILKEKEDSYSYAELVHSIYHMTRDDNTYSRELVACVLSSFTLYLSEIYWEYQYEKRKENKNYYDKYIKKTCQEISVKESQESFNLIEKNYKILLGVIGDTVCGHWTDYYFPEIAIGTYSSRRINENQVASYIEKANARYELRLNLREKNAIAGVDKKEKQRIKKKIRLQIYELLFVCMIQKDFLSMLNKGVKESELTLEKNSNGKRNLKIEILFDGDIDFTAFFKHTFAYVDFLDKMDEVFFSKWIEELKKQKFYNDAYLIKNIVDEIREEYWKWDQQYGTAMIPVYNLDISYNLIKHIFKECEKEQMDAFIFLLEDGNKNSFSKTKEDKIEEFLAIFEEKDEEEYDEETILKFLEEYMKMMKRFSNHLYSIDEFYKISEGKRFQAIFCNCPFFKMLEKLIKNGHRTEENEAPLRELLDFLNSIFGNMLANIEIEKAPGERS